MNIRSLTVGAALPLDPAARAELISRLGDFAVTGRSALQVAGFTVQSTRLSSQPLELWLDPADRDQACSTVADVGKRCTAAGLDYCSLGTVQAASSEPDPGLDAL